MSLLSARLGVKGPISQRKRLGLSAAEGGLRVGASAQQIYKWEVGEVRPRAKHLMASPAFVRWESARRLRDWRQFGLKRSVWFIGNHGTPRPRGFAAMLATHPSLAEGIGRYT